jgi:PAS domain S-box-containing protein
MFISTNVLTQAELQSAIIHNPLVVDPTTTVMEAIAQMSGVRTICSVATTTDSQLDDVYIEARSSCVLIVKDSHLLGIFTERDVVRLSAQQRSLDKLQIGEVMTHPTITLQEKAFQDIFFAINLLQQHRIRHLPIVDEGFRVVGLLTHESLRQALRPVDLLRLRLVNEVMSSEVICATSDASMLAIAHLMVENRISSVVIVQFMTENKSKPVQIPIGIVTERDIVQFQALNLDLETYLVEVVMSTPIFTVKPEDTLWMVQKIMKQRRIHRVVVTGFQGELLGIVTQSSLLQMLNPVEIYKFAEALEKKVLQLEAEKVEILQNRTIALEQQVQERTATLRGKIERERLISKIANRIHTSLNLQELLANCVTEVRNFLGCDRILVYQFQPDWSGIIVSESVGDDWLPSIGNHIKDSFYQEQAIKLYEHGRTIVVDNIYTVGYTDCHIYLLEKYQIKSNLVVPILASDRLWGLLIGHQCKDYRSWHTDDVALLDEMGVQLAIAIQQASAYEQVLTELVERRKTEVRLRESEQRYATLASAAPVGILRTDLHGNSLYINQRGMDMIGLPEARTTGSGWQKALHPDDREKVILAIEQSRWQNHPFQMEYRFLGTDGTVTWVYGQAEKERNAEGEITGYINTFTDITARKQAELLLEMQNTLLERIAKAEPLPEILHVLIDSIEKQLPGGLCSILLCDQEGKLRIAAAPNLPEFYNQAIDGTVIGEGITSCMTMAFRGESVIVADIASDPLWQNFKEFALSQGLRSCWSVPAIASDGEVLAIFAIYYQKPYQPQEQEIEIIHLAANIAKIAIERDRAAKHLQDIIVQKQAEENIREQAERERLLREITQRIRQSLDLQTIFQTAVQEIRNFIQADRVGIFKFHPECNSDDGEFVAESVVPGYKSVLAVKIHDHWAATQFGEEYAAIYQQGRIQVFNDISQAGLLDCDTDVLAKYQVKANLVVPLLNGGNFWGLLCVHQCSAPRVWKKTEIELIQQIANQLAIAIQQASLYKQMQSELIVRQQAEARLTQSNQQLAISNEQLARATRLKDEFLANMSHELRTPLNAILGMTEGLQEEVFGSLKERQQKALQTIRHSGTHLLELINDILDLAKIEAGQVELDCAPTSIDFICQTSVVFIKQQAFKKGLKVHLQVPSHLPNLPLDERRIRQVLINLLNNAVKFTPEGGSITLKVTLVSSTDATKPNRINIAVIDTGIGIAPYDLQKIFQPFIQVDSALNRKYQGTGLGLSLVKQIVELHGGSVEVSSELGVGSQFTIDLPCPDLLTQYPQSLRNLTSQLTKSPGEVATTSPLILIAEDNEANIITLSSYLEAKGYRLLLANNGQEAIKLTLSQQPNLILMDIQMPVMDGLETIKQIRSNPKLIDLPIIALSALAMTGDREKCLEAGANDYLTKPVKLKQLAITIQSYLR